MKSAFLTALLLSLTLSAFGTTPVQPQPLKDAFADFSAWFPKCTRLVAELSRLAAKPDSAELSRVVDEANVTCAQIQDSDIPAMRRAFSEGKSLTDLSPMFEELVLSLTDLRTGVDALVIELIRAKRLQLDDRMIKLLREFWLEEVAYRSRFGPGVRLDLEKLK